MTASLTIGASMPITLSLPALDPALRPVWRDWGL